MILKASQRGDGADLAIHLMNGFDNDSIEIAEVYGTIAGDLYGAFAEFEAIARGTKAQNYLYSLSISPSAPLTREQYHEAIQSIEARLGLTNQPRAVVFHIKRGKDGIAREHCHVVWSRIDIENMRAIHLSHDHSKLMDLACELARKFGHDLPAGLKAWEQGLDFEKDKLEPSLAESAQQKATGISLEERRAEITQAYNSADSIEAFRQALEQKGYILTRGDRRALVVVDRFGNVHSLTRCIKGHKEKDVRARLAGIDPARLPSVDDAKELAAMRAQAVEERRREQERAWERLQERAREYRARLEIQVAKRRRTIMDAEQALLTRQQAERLALHAAQHSESTGLVFRARTAVADLIARMPGLRSVLAHIQRLTHLDPRERHQLENEALARRHAREKHETERLRRFSERIETRERRSLEERFARDVEQEFSLLQEFAEPKARKAFTEGMLSETFNDEAGFEQREHGAGGDDEGEAHAPEYRDENGDDDGGRPKHRRRRGKGYSYRRDSD